MTTRRVKWLGIVLPILFWIVIVAVRTLLLPDSLAIEFDIAALSVIVVVAIAFWLWAFHVAESREEEIQRRTRQLEALHSAALTLTTELELGTVLQTVIDLSRNLVNSRYGALGVLDENGTEIRHFITSGISAEERRQIGPLPRGHGLLGVLIREGKPIRVPQIGSHPQSVGFPPNHPPMRSLLGVPIISKGKVIGDLYLTDKITVDPTGTQSYTVFSQADQELLGMFATQAAIAIENAQLLRQTQQLAILQERERFRMDLHDGIIQSIFAIGLMLEDAQYHMQTQPAHAHQRITHSIHDLNEVIRDIRNYIMELQPQRFQGRDLNQGIEELVRDVRANSFLSVQLSTTSLSPDLLTPEQTVEILHIAQEALTNVRKHARASTVGIATSLENSHVELCIWDDGVGFDPAATPLPQENGLRNMRERAHALSAQMTIGRREPGTQVNLIIPLPLPRD